MGFEYYLKAQHLKSVQAFNQAVHSTFLNLFTSKFGEHPTGAAWAFSGEKLVAMLTLEIIRNLSQCVPTIIASIAQSSDDKVKKALTELKSRCNQIVEK